MRKIVFPKYSKIALIISGVLLAIYFSIEYLEKFYIYIYLFGVDSTDLMPFLTLPAAALLMSAIAVLFYKNINLKWLKELIVITIIALFILIFLYLLAAYAMTSFAPSEFYEFTSDDGKHHIIVEEHGFFFSGGGVVCEKTSFCTMKRVGGYTTDDGYNSLFNNDFYFVWNENDFELHYAYSGGETPDEYRVVKMEYLK